MTANPLTFGGHERCGLLPRRLNHDASCVARPIRLPLGNQIDTIVIVASPRRVALAEHVERRASHREAALILARARLEDVVAAVLERDVERHGLSRRGDGPRSRFDVTTLGVPRVETVAFCAADAGPLNLCQRDVHDDAGHDDAVRPHSHDLGLQAGLLLEEVRGPAQPDVPGRRMNRDARTVGDVLT